MVCCATLARSSQGCLRCCCILFCIFLCIGPMFVLAGILVWILPGLQVVSLPQVRTYNTLAALFAQVQGPLMQQSQFKVSSAVPLLGVPFNDWNKLSLILQAPLFSGISYGLSTVQSVTFAGTTGSMLSTVTQFFSVRVTLSGNSFTYQHYVPVSRMVTYPILCTALTQCTNMSVSNCPGGLKTYSGTATCAPNTVCGTCTGRANLSRLCFLVDQTGTVWTPASRQGCFYPFTYAGFYQSSAPQSTTGVTIRNINDPSVLANDLTQGSMNFNIAILLPQTTQLLTITLCVIGGIFAVCGCFISCCLFFSEDGRKCYYRAMGDDDEVGEEDGYEADGAPMQMVGPPQQQMMPGQFMMPQQQQYMKSPAPYANGMAQFPGMMQPPRLQVPN